MKEVIVDSKGNAKIKVTEAENIKVYTPKEYEDKLKADFEDKEPEIDRSGRTLSELKAECKENGLKTSGTKPELIERLAGK